MVAKFSATKPFDEAQPDKIKAIIPKAKMLLYMLNVFIFRIGFMVKGRLRWATVDPSEAFLSEILSFILMKFMTQKLYRKTNK